jgi:multidrug efflux pump
LQRRGLSLLEAAVEAGATRLRPVLLTAGTTVLGLIPMATGVSYDFHKMAWALKSESSQWWASMAVAIIFGLSFATILTLVVVPTLYVSLMRLAQRIGLSIDGRRTESGPGNLPAPELPQIT